MNDLHFITCGILIDYQAIGVPQVFQDDENSLGFLPMFFLYVGTFLKNVNAYEEEVRGVFKIHRYKVVAYSPTRFCSTIGSTHI